MTIYHADHQHDQHDQHVYDRSHDDDTMLHRLREACTAREQDPGSVPDEQLFALRDHALSRGLPLPSSCPLDGTHEGAAYPPVTPDPPLPPGYHSPLDEHPGLRDLPGS